MTLMVWVRGVRTLGGMIRVLGEEYYGTAAELAAVLGPDVTPAMIRRWADRAGLPAYRDGRTVLYPLARAAEIDRSVRRSARGRPRRVAPAAPRAA